METDEGPSHKSTTTLLNSRASEDPIETVNCVQNCGMKCKGNGLITSSSPSMVNGIDSPESTIDTLESHLPSTEATNGADPSCVSKNSPEYVSVALNETERIDDPSKLQNQEPVRPLAVDHPSKLGDVIADNITVVKMVNGNDSERETNEKHSQDKFVLPENCSMDTQESNIVEKTVSHDSSNHEHSIICNDAVDDNAITDTFSIPLSNISTSSQTKAADNQFKNSDMSNSLNRQLLKNLPDVLNECSNLSNASEASQESQDTQSQDLGAELEPGSATKSTKKKKPPSRRKTDLTMHALNGSVDHSGLTADKLVEYRWPDGKGGQWYMIQEQVSEFLGVLSFKRKYPKLDRRAIEPEERQMLQEKRLVTEMQSDLGLTPVRADQIHDLMSRDYPLKFQDYLLVLRDRKKKQQIERQRELQEQRNDKTRMAQLRQKAMQSAAQFNTFMNRERREERQGYIDLQTFEVHYPRKNFMVLPPAATKVGSYPVALLPGQYQDNYRQFNSEELKQLPVNTAYHPGYNPDAEVPENQDDDASSVSTEASRLVNSDGESVELGSEIFEEGDDTEQDAEKQKEIDSKVKELLDQLHAKSKPGPKTKRKSMAAPSTSESHTSVENTPGKGGRRKLNAKDDPETPPPAKTPRRSKKQQQTKTPVYFCNICGGNEDRNKEGVKEEMVQCAQCQRFGHPKCLELTEELIPVIKTYPWQCMECKTCVECQDAQHEDKMLFCDHCDRGYHTFCVGLEAIPNGRWECSSCTPTSSRRAKDNKKS